jgi:DDB1- and CUL4-associated factor 13
VSWGGRLPGGRCLTCVCVGVGWAGLAWQEPLNFVVASEDANLYTFDLRRLDEAKLVHKDHVGAVMDVAFSPTGQEFVAGSYDRSVRIFRHRDGRSREVYHTKRMQRVFCVNFSGDGRFVLSGSDDTNLRIWKAQASKRLGPMVPRMEKKLQYLDTIKGRYKHMPEIRRIAKHRHVPKAIKKAAELERIQKDSERRKAENRRKHARPDSDEFNFVPERKKRVLSEMA